MKYAIYDKAADGYLTKMEFEVGYSEHTQFECGYNEYITEAKLLDTSKEAADSIVRIESYKFMDKGRFVVHSFDDTLKDHYIISEAGTPTKVVDNITVNLDGNIDVKYGTMPVHWSCSTLDYVINRMNSLQKARSPLYSSWCNTFDIYKVITVIDEKSCTHYQFINVTAKGLEKYAKDEEVVSFNKRIEELEKTNYEFGKRLESRATLVNDLRVQNTNLKNKVESVKKEAHDWKTLYENAKKDREVLTNVIDNIYDDLSSTDIRKGLKETYDYMESLSELNYIKIHNDDTDDGEPVYITAAAEFKYIIDQITAIMESRDLNQSIAFSSAEEMTKAKDIAEKVIDICDSNNDFTVQLYKFSKLYATIDNISKTTNSSLMMAFNKFLALMSTTNKSLDKILGNNIDMMIKWRSESEKLRKDLENQKKINDTNKATIARMVVEKRTMNKELSDAVDALESTRKVLTTVTNERDKVIEQKNKYERMLNSVYGYSDTDYAVAYCQNDAKLSTEIKKYTSIRDSLAEVIFAIRNAIYHNDSDAFCCIENRMKIDSDFNSDPFMAGVRENIKDICVAEKKNIANNDLKNSEIARLTEERDKALERAEKFKGIANSVYGMTIPGRCCGKQLMADILSGKKIPISKDKYDSIITSLKLIDLSYEGVYGTMIQISPKPKPTWLPGLMRELEDLTE